MTTTTRPVTPDAETAARDSLARIYRILAEDRAEFAARVASHEGRITASSGRPALDGPPPAAPVNPHPGPDFYPDAAR
jgi:hypothetical protein